LADEIQKSTFSTAYGVFATHRSLSLGGLALEDEELVAQRQILEAETGTGLECRKQSCKDYRNEVEHDPLK
jgi:hypothetical protein